jgi:adenylate cyclase
VQRKLAAILSADAVGFGRLMELDETGTMARLTSLRRDVIDPAIAAHHGRIFKLMGDGVLVEYASVVDAVTSAIEIQRGLTGAESQRPDGQHIVFRIGINLGDVMIDGTDIYGEGVNVAARVQSLANPGGIAVSSTVREHVGRKLAVEFEDFGEHSVKNSERPVRVYMVNLGHGAVAVAATAAGPAARVTDHRPSIVVLPFSNMSGDPEQEYFSDGISEDIITDLSKVSGLSVIARNTAFTFKGKAVLVEQIAKQLRVNFVLEGSVRKAGGRVRISAQLIRGLDNFHVWAERYDRNLDDIFALQDEISKSVVDALKVALLPKELETITNRSTDNLEAYQFFLMGRSFFHRGIESRTLKIARLLFAKAVAVDPNYARAYAGLADCDSFLLFGSDPTVTYETVIANSTRALELQPGLADAHASRGLALCIAGRHADAESEFQQALRLDPESFEVHYFYGRHCILLGQHEKCVALSKRAATLMPDDYRPWGHLQMSYASLGRLEDAAEAARQGMQRFEKEVTAHPDNAFAWSRGAGLLVQLGETERALSWAARAELFAADDAVIQYNIGCCYAQLGRIDQAIDRLERLLAGPPVIAGRLVSWMNNDSDLEAVRGHPRFLDLIAKLEARGAAKP